MTTDTDVLERFLKAGSLNSIDYIAPKFGAYGLDTSYCYAEADSIPELCAVMLEREALGVPFSDTETWEG